jgi:hypothetical protein
LKEEICVCTSLGAWLSFPFFLSFFGFSSEIEPLLLSPQIAFLVPSQRFSLPKMVKWLMLSACHAEYFCSLFLFYVMLLLSIFL